MFNIRTDLALEAKEIYENDQKSTEIPGVKVKNKDLETTMDFAGYYYDLYRQFFAWFIDFKNSYDKNLDGKKVLDLGCDNGITTCFVANLYPNSEIIGVDKCKKGIKCAEEIAQKLGVKNVKFEAVDAKKVDKFFKEEKFDLVLSNRSMLEITNLPKLYASIYPPLSESFNSSAIGVIPKSGLPDASITFTPISIALSTASIFLAGNFLL